MPKYEDKDGDGVLFINEQCNPEMHHPEFTGKVLINGVRFKLAGWKGSNDAGKKWIKLKAQPVEENAEYTGKVPPKAVTKAPAKKSGDFF